MAKRTLLGEASHSELINQIKTWESSLPKENIFEFCLQMQKRISSFIEYQLYAEFQKHPDWEKSKPIVLGSWAWGELCPKSDLDLLFCGEEKYVRSVANHIESAGYKLRYHMPEDLKDWTKGVESFDVVALLNAKALYQGEELKAQQQKILDKGAKFRKELLREMLEERKSRNLRYDSIINYLEPNLKYGPGGLRDLQQALYIVDLFPDKFSKDTIFYKGLQEYKALYLYIRQSLHLAGASDIIIAGEQKSLSQSLGFATLKEFMAGVQKGLGRVSFYADWVVEVAQTSPARMKKIENLEFDSPADVIESLKREKGILMQAHIRWQIESLFAKENFVDSKQIGQCLRDCFDGQGTSDLYVSLFRSRFIDFAVPALREVAGLVQHDQYHRYSVDAHLLQSLREVARIKILPESLGALQSYVEELNDKDWVILTWSALYHDLAKGQAGDHSVLGEELVWKDLTRLGLPESLIKEVAWMVKNHLYLSQAAFRRNPDSPQTWAWLNEKGMAGRRLVRMALFTAIDIKATNPEAWGPWKESLILRVTESLLSKPAKKYMELLHYAHEKSVVIDPGFLKGLDSFVIENLPSDVLVKDYIDLSQSQGDLEDLFCSVKKGEVWVRFHKANDASGLFLGFVKKLYASGCRVRESSVRSFDDYGVYDWFKVKTSKSPEQLAKLFKNIKLDKVVVPEVSFTKVQLVSIDDDEVVIRFRGANKDGVLLKAVESLAQSGLSILWARVMTWGQQIDDVFGVKKEEKTAEFFEQFVDQFK